MLPPPAVEVFAGLVLLFVLCLPLGLFLARAAERLLTGRVSLSCPERILLAFYAAGALLFVIASLPTGLYGRWEVIVLLALGFVGYGALAARDRGSGLAAGYRFLRSTPGIVLAAGSVALLIVELWSALVPLPNGVDGTVYALFVNVLLRNHGVAWTLEPFAASGIIYPQGAPVWMSLPVLLYGWPIVSAPIVLPPLFLSFTPAAAYCLGERLAPLARIRRERSGLLFAAFFGLTASWPRLYVAGSYDFIFALPMFLVALGLIADDVRDPARPWAHVVAVGLLLGALSALSLAIGTALILLFAGYGVAYAARRASLWGVLVRFLAVVALAIAFVSRSVAGVVMWFGYPGHVVTSTGNPPYAPIVSGNTFSGWQTQLDPFVPWKPKISPIPPLYVELEALFLAGIILCALVALRPSGAAGRYLHRDLVVWVGVGTAVLLIETAVLLGLGNLNSTVSGIQSISNVWETSFLLFIFYALVALLPLVAAARFLASHQQGITTDLSQDRTSPKLRGRAGPVGGRSRRWGAIGALVIVTVPLLSGAVCTVAYVPGYVHTSIVAEANTTNADLAALEWAGAHLPSCSRVLVAPGSAAQFLPEYAVVQLVYPVFPSPTNLTYHQLYDDFVSGEYPPSARAGLLLLGITEVFVTGPTTDAYPAFPTSPFLESSDFSVLFAEGDALIVSFSPGVAASGCAPA